MEKETSRESSENINENMHEDLFDDADEDMYEDVDEGAYEETNEDIDAKTENVTEEAAEKHTRRGKKQRKQKKHKKRRVSTVIISVVLVLMMFYYALTFLNIPPLRTIRNLWIETAMTTMTHQWLATYFFPDFIIDDIMDDRTQPLETITGLRESKEEDVDEENTEEEKNDDILGQADLKVGDADIAGNEILVNDIEQGIIISEVTTSSYTGRVALIDDPSRVFIGYTTSKGTVGLHIVDMLKAHNAVLGMNASGFYDSGGHGNGGEVLGRSMSEGETWGEYESYMDSICFDTNNWLIAGKIEDWDEYNVRDGMQFTPVLVKDGEKNLNGTGGYGMQPRTCIGQREDGVVIFLVIDGRQPTHSIGATMLDCADIMLDYGAVTAVACDGGSSSVMAYDGKVITKPSGGDGVNGRYLPNAFMVKRK